MSQYNPDKWLLIKIGGTDPHYRVFGSWSGGYLDGDSWRMNSGITRVEEDGDYYKFFGSSGSCYRCHKEMYGATAYGWGVATGYIDDDRLTIMEKPDNIMDMDWII
jgi:hypothetical protein